MEKPILSEKNLYVQQNKVHFILRAFYTGSGLSFWNKLTYPYFLANDKSINRMIDEITQIVSSIVFSLEFKKKKSKHIQISIPLIDISAYPLHDKEYTSVLKKLKCIGERLHAEKKGTLLLFGSLATMDYVKGYSDLDTVFIIRKEACLNKKKLLEIRKDIAAIMRESYFIDSLQHHGPYMFTEYDLEMFPQYYLPFAVWKNMVSLCGDIVLRFRERQTYSEEITGELQRYKEMFLKIMEKPLSELPKNNYSRKYLYQAILLFPAVYLLSNGKPCYKKDSFVMIRKHLSEHGNALLDALSDVWRTNGFNTKVASPNVQAFFRMIPYPFCYPFICRLFFPDTLEREQRQKIECLLKDSAREYVELVDAELKKHGNTKSR